MKLEYISISFLAVSFIVLCGSLIVALPRIYDGLHLYAPSHQQAIKQANEYDPNGIWVCVNVNQMSIDKALNTCNHEVAHEIFARNCENNITKCINISENG